MAPSSASEDRLIERCAQRPQNEASEIMAKRMNERRTAGFAGAALAILLSTAAIGAAPGVWAAEPDAAVARVQTLDETLAVAAKKGELRGPKMRQTLEQSFNLAIMAQVAVGAPWSTLSASDRSGIVDALSRYTEARFAHEFKDYGGQPIQIDPNVQVRGPDKLVRAEIRDPGEPVQKIGYRLREYSGQWRIIDVIYNGVSQLATQRADFSGALQSGGAAGLIKSLDQATAKLK